MLSKEILEKLRAVAEALFMTGHDGTLREVHPERAIMNRHMQALMASDYWIKANPQASQKPSAVACCPKSRREC